MLLKCSSNEKHATSLIISVQEYSVFMALIFFVGPYN